MILLLQTSGVIRRIFDKQNFELSLKDAVWANRAKGWRKAEHDADEAELYEERCLKPPPSEAGSDEEFGIYLVLNLPDIPDLSCRERRRVAVQEPRQRLDSIKSLIGRIDTVELLSSLSDANDID